MMHKCCLRKSIIYAKSRRLSARSRSFVSASKSSGAPKRSGSSKKPYVALFGWLGAKPVHFQKYKDLWTSLGHPVCGIQPWTSGILAPPIGDFQAQRVLKQLADLQHQHTDRALLIHSFSNAGFLFLATVLRLLAKDAQHSPASGSALWRESWLSSAAGIVFDSAPTRLTPDIAARGFVAAALSQPAQGVEGRHARLVAAAQGVFSPLLGSRYISNRSDELWQTWQSHAPLAKQLYLYSEFDALIVPSEVQRFQKLQRQRGVNIQEYVWKDSAHCEHYRRHPDEYRLQLQNFAAEL